MNMPVHRTVLSFALSELLIMSVRKQRIGLTPWRRCRVAWWLWRELSDPVPFRRPDSDWRTSAWRVSAPTMKSQHRSASTDTFRTRLANPVKSKSTTSELCAKHSLQMTPCRARSSAASPIRRFEGGPLRPNESNATPGGHGDPCRHFPSDAD